MSIRKILYFVLVVTLVLSLSSISFAEQKIDKSAKEKLIKTETLKAFKEFKKRYPNAQIIKDQSDVIALGPASPLTAMWVDQVGSTLYGGYEYTKNKYSTTNDHGGAEMYVYTYERGYATPSSRIAKIGGSKLSQWDYQMIDEDGDSIIDGFFIGWDACGHQSGQFTYEARSTNSPWNTMSTWINIK